MEKDKKFGNFTVGNWGMEFYVGDCTLDTEDIENLRKALKEYDKRRRLKK